MSRSRAWAVLALLAAPLALPAQQPGDTASVDLPADRGRLRQDDITLHWQTGNLDVRFIPLDERVLRLLAPDAYHALRDLRAANDSDIARIGRRRGVEQPGVALVTFHALTPGTRFDPQLLSVTVRGRLLRPLGTIQLSTAFSSQQLDVRDQAIGLVVFEDRLPIHESFTAAYADRSSGDWGSRVSRLDAERARILALPRAAADTTHER